MFRRGKFALLTGAVMALLLSACAVASIPAAQEEQAGGAATPAAAAEETDSMAAAGSEAEFQRILACVEEVTTHFPAKCNEESATSPTNCCPILTLCGRCVGTHGLHKRGSDQSRYVLDPERWRSALVQRNRAGLFRRCMSGDRNGARGAERGPGTATGRWGGGYCNRRIRQPGAGHYRQPNPQLILWPSVRS